MSRKIVFISYSHDSNEHCERVLALSERLREDGIETRLDQYVNGSPAQGWPRWMLDQLDEANYVLVICTETYYRRFRGREEPGKGKGVDWEGALVIQELYDSRSRTLKFVPVLFSAADARYIPEPLRALTYNTLTSEEEYQRLYDFLLEQAGAGAGPFGVLKSKPLRIGAALTFGDTTPKTSVETRIDISRIDKYAPDKLIGRDAEKQLLSDAWAKAQRDEVQRPHILTFVAFGGEGKTSLVAKWVAELAHEGWPGCEAVFAWSFYSQGTREQAAASSDLFLREALIAFGDAEMANSAKSAIDKGRRLAQLVGTRRALLILDGVEPLQYAPTAPMPGELKDRGLSALLKGLSATNRGLCVVTTRYSLPDLKAYWQSTAPEIQLTRLSQEGGVELLRQLNIHGSQQEFVQLVEDVKGHALTLNLLGTFLRDAHAGDIRKRDLVKLEEADDEEQGGHAFRVLDAYVKWFADGGEKGQRALAMLRLMGLFDRPATADCIFALLQAPAIPNLTNLLIGISETLRNLAITKLESAKLLTVNRETSTALLSLDAHPLLREYFARQLHDSQPDAWHAANRRLYEHLCSTTQEGEQPTLDDLQPLYQAVAHGCLAGMQQESFNKVYRIRILRGTSDDGFYALYKLGAFASDLSSVANFFETPWGNVSSTLTEADQAWLMKQAGYSLHALGRLYEAREPMLAALEINIKLKDWQNAAITAGNLSVTELALGNVDNAVKVAEQSVRNADLSGDAYQSYKNRTCYAYALLQADCLTKAEALFLEAENLKAEHQADNPKPNWTRGFRYNDFLLAIPERAAWQCTLNAFRIHHRSSLLETCRNVSQRALRSIKIAKSHNWLLDIALGNLILGRSGFFMALLNSKSLAPCHEFIDAAVDGLRRAGYQDDLPRGLLTRAWLGYLEGDTTGSRADLDEAWEIAIIGPMPLFQADIHLYRARLFGGRQGENGRLKPYPWESPQMDLAEARRLIEKHGYWRQREELEDAEIAILSAK